MCFDNRFGESEAARYTAYSAGYCLPAVNHFESLALRFCRSVMEVVSLCLFGLFRVSVGSQADGETFEVIGYPEAVSSVEVGFERSLAI